MARPAVRWSQSERSVGLLLLDPSLSLRVLDGGTEVAIHGDDGATACELPLFAQVLVVAPAPRAAGGAVLYTLEKATPGAAPWPRLTACSHADAPARIATDWSRYDCGGDDSDIAD